MGEWWCDGRDMEGRCLSGTTYSARGKERYSCAKCNFNLCARCYLMRTGQKVCEKDHTIMALDMSYDDGWACAGRKLPGGCKRSISGNNQSGGLRRFGCKKCQ